MKTILNQLFNQEDLTSEQAEHTMNAIMDGKISSAEIGAFLGALRTKGETVAEIVGCARSLQNHAVPLKPQRTDLLDTCGTGGDGANTFNISTTVSFVLAASGVGLCKHGNRSISSKCGSADVLEELGVPIDNDRAQAEKAIDRYGYSFLFAPKFHPAMGQVAQIRRQIGARTIFNLLGPLVNPARTPFQVIGVYDSSKLTCFAEVLRNLGSKHVFLVTGDDGLDEITTTTTTQMVELKEDIIRKSIFDPKDYGIKRATAEDLLGGDRKENAAITEAILKGEMSGPKTDIVAVNAAAALIVTGKASDFSSGIKLAMKVISSGKAYEKLEQIRSSNRGV